MLSGITVADELIGSRIEVLLSNFHAFAEWARRRLVQDANPGARALGHFNSEQTNCLVLATGADGPDLTSRKRVRANAVLTLKLRRGDELLHPIQTHNVAKLGVTEFG